MFGRVGSAAGAFVDAMSATALASASAAAFFGSPPLPPPPAPPTAAYARQWLYALALASLMVWRGRRKGSLSRDGAAAAFAVGLVSCAASVRLGLTLIAFFVTASRLTKVGAARKRELEDGHTEGGNRNWVQVAANGALGTLLAAAYHASTRARARRRSSRSTPPRSRSRPRCRRRTSATTRRATPTRGRRSWASSVRRSRAS